MKWRSIGQYIRNYRIAKRWRQEDLAEKTGLTPTYIGLIERGEKIPALETFVSILNALDASADVVLADVLVAGHKVKTSILNEKLEKLDKKERDRILAVVDTLIKHA